MLAAGAMRGVVRGTWCGAAAAAAPRAGVRYAAALGPRTAIAGVRGARATCAVLPRIGAIRASAVVARANTSLFRALPRAAPAPTRGAVRFFMSSASRRSAKAGNAAPVGTMRRLFNQYDALLYSNPIKTKACTAFVIFAIGDILAQLVQRARRPAGTAPQPFDITRMLRGSLFGFCVAGPANHYNFMFLEYLVAGRFGLVGFPMAVTKMFFDQFVYFAFFMCGSYHVFMNTLEGRPAAETWEKLKDNFWDTMKANWMLWPAVQIVNFMFIPIAWQLNFVLAASVVWALFLSFAFQGKEEAVAPIEADAPAATAAAAVNNHTRK